jgi:hypothetical protein
MAGKPSHGGRKPVDEKIRFESQVKRLNSGCWEYTGAKNRGYGSMKRAGRKTISAHRFAYIIEFGEIPKSMMVCHSCDNPACVNPAHLFLGTAQENNDDMRNKGRARYPGPKSPEKHRAAILILTRIHVDGSQSRKKEIKKAPISGG